MALYVKIRSLSFTLMDMEIIYAFRKMTLGESAEEKDRMQVNMSEGYYNNLCREDLKYSLFRKKRGILKRI